MSLPTLSFVIVTYNSADTIELDGFSSGSVDLSEFAT